MVPERQYVKSLNPYSRMALAVRGWGLEVVLALGIFVLWHIGAALDGPGAGILMLGVVGLVVWRTPALKTRVATTLRDRATRRWFSRVLIACQLISPRGLIPRIEGTDLIPARTAPAPSSAARPHRRDDRAGKRALGRHHRRP
jgi:hypothetical protein